MRVMPPNSAAVTFQGGNDRATTRNTSQNRRTAVMTRSASIIIQTVRMARGRGQNGREIVGELSSLTTGWKDGSVVLGRAGSRIHELGPNMEAGDVVALSV